MYNAFKNKCIEIKLFRPKLASITTDGAKHKVGRVICFLAFVKKMIILQIS